MPLTIKVDLNRKASMDYQSLLTRPDELQDAVSELYEQAELALDRQVTSVRWVSQWIYRWPAHRLLD